MGPALTIIHVPGFDDGLGFGKRGELVHVETLKHSSRTCPLIDSMNECSKGFPRRMKSNCDTLNLSSARDRNSVS